MKEMIERDGNNVKNKYRQPKIEIADSIDNLPDEIFRNLIRITPCDCDIYEFWEHCSVGDIIEFLDDYEKDLIKDGIYPFY